jgi:legumain
MYNDVINATENPFPGTLYNKIEGADVYEGCKIDYSGPDVRKENFIAILEG